MMPIVPEEDTLVYKQLYTIKPIDKKQIQKRISNFLIFLAVILLILQFLPLAVSYIRGMSLQHINAANNPNIIPVSTSYMHSLFTAQYVDPGQAYFTSLVKAYQEQQEHVKIDTSYKKIMYLDIPSLNMKHVRLEPNVPSSPESVYQKALSKGVAHLKGTPLPGAGGNSIIYGHSGITSLLRFNNPGLVFTKLEKIQVGAKIYIHKDGKTLTYKVMSKKIIPPQDLSTVVKASNIDRITLVTCWPLGVGTKRLIVIAYRQ